MFINLGFNVNDQDEGGRTILNWAITSYVKVINEEGDFIMSDAIKLQLINLLIDNGADVSLADADGNDALKLAFIRGLPDFMITRIIDAIKS